MLGISAGFLWTGAGFIQFAYADEDSKAMYITVQWVLTSLGGTVGAFISFGANFHQTEATGVSNAVYAVFIVIMCLAMVVAAFGLKDPEDIVRDDGTHLAVFHPTDFWTEVKGVGACFTELRILIILPGIFCAEIVLVLMSSINGYYFDLRTRSLANIIFEMIMIPAPLALAWAMDNKYMTRRRTRGMLGVAIMAVITLATYAGVIGWLVRNDVDRSQPPPAVDWSMSSFASGFVLYILSGIIYSGFQICGQWTLSALSNDPYKCARYAGLFKGTTSLGLMAAFLMDSKNVSYLDQAIVHLVLYAVGVISLVSVTWFCVRDTNYFLEPDVIAPQHITEEACVHGVITQDEVSEEKNKQRVRDGKRPDSGEQGLQPVVAEIGTDKAA
ncbi:hypothetical protein A1O3_06929 [Capronia epimyces CBS 606.96]|uniref:Uncharacterized protein n=1 Tax=Capronia epimyces CBS 606.96 TaxID=1182542 RepID=W9XTH6_9EURO|nr:uncharacterized protein A1O3_06929 [Capronia epimyces CBS 606.96]EXJ80645.1 hypothetical protein A1O3_06929 [Capronia epimyces CBS 606.96]